MPMYVVLKLAANLKKSPSFFYWGLTGDYQSTGLMMDTSTRDFKPKKV
jgi:hypothetical protein